MARMRYALIALVAAAYIFGSQWLMTAAPESAWAVVALLSPMLIAVMLGAWRAKHRWLSVGATLLFVALCAAGLSGAHVSAQALYLAQHVGVNLFLGAWFASTLRPGAQALISQLAARVRHLTPGKAVYTRKLTFAWVVFFAAIVAVSVALFTLAPFDTWALFANVVTPVAVVSMFVGEYLLRYRLHPEFDRTTLGDAIRAYRQGSGNDTAVLTPTARSDAAQ
jgi:uncharacterized membrane protein